MIEQNIRAALIAQPAIAALITTRCYPIVIPTESQLPALTFQIVGSASNQGQTTHGMQRIRLQIDCWSLTYLEAVTLRDAVSTAMDGYQDANLSCLLLGKVDFFEAPSLQYRALVEFYVFTTSV
jgi:hypothetical protein